MNAERLRKVRHVFEAALRSDAEGRDALLRDASVDDPTLRDEVERLLANETRTTAEDFAGATQGYEPGCGDTAAETTAVFLQEEAQTLCPRCRNPVAISASSESEEVVCTACGSSVRGDRSATGAWESAVEGRCVGRFTLMDRVGAGAFGTVYRALDPDLDRVVALKMLRAGQFATETDRARFLREARNAARLKHASIVAVHEVGEHEGGPFIVSDFIRGVTLAERIAAGRPPIPESIALAAQIADALQYAHEHGVVHRDVKPLNVMLDEQGRPHLMDFGLAKRDTGEVTVTLDGALLGTPAYMSPEQARGEGHLADPRGDVYSLGVLLYELLTGERPFRGNQRMLLNQVLNDEPPPPRTLNDRIPRDVETICLKAMAKERGRRYATAGELADDLRRALGGEPILARRTGRPERAWRWCRRNPWLAAAAVSTSVGLLVAVVSLAFYSMLSLRLNLEHEQAVSSIRDSTAVLENRWKRSRFVSEQAALARAEAVTAAKNIRVRLNTDRIEPRLRAEIVGRIEQVERDADRDEKFSRTLEDFDRIRASQKETGVEGTAAAYSATALRAGFDPLAPNAQAVLADMLRDRPVGDHKALASRLEAWAIIEWKRTGQHVRWHRLIELVKGFDPDPGLAAVRHAWLAQDPAALSALASVERAQNLEPNGLLMLVSWLVSVEDRPRAVSLLRRGLIRHPYDIWLNYYMGANLAELGATGEAEAVIYYRVARALRPETGHELAHLLQSGGHNEEAESIFRELTTRSPENAQHLVCLGILLKREGDRKGEADQILARAVETAVASAARMPGDPSTQIVLGNALGQTGRVDEAISRFRNALKLAPDLHDVHVNIADLLVRKKAYDDAIREFRLGLKGAPGDVRIRAELGDALNGAGREEEAIEQYRAIVRLTPDAPRARLILADSLRRARRTDEAIAEYRRGLQEAPGETSSRYNLADLLAARGEIDDAVANYRRALGEVESPDARFSLADLLRQDGQNVEAVEEYRRALQLRPHVVPALLSLGLALRELGRYEESIAEYERALALSRDDRETASRIEQDLNWTRHFVELSRRLPDVIQGKTQPGDAAERALLAEVAFAQGNARAAATLWEKAFGDDPSLATAVEAGYRAHAVLAAARAGTSGPNPGVLPSDGVHWRGKAAEWLAAELAAGRAVLERSATADRLLLRTHLRTFRRSPELAVVRDDATLKTLPLDEQRTWRELWSQIDSMLSVLTPQSIPPAV